MQISIACLCSGLCKRQPSTCVWCTPPAAQAGHVMPMAAP